MAQQIREIMNEELFTLNPEEPASNALLGILSLGITGAPVVDAEGKALGLVSLRDLLGERGGRAVGDRMTTPAITVREDATIEEAGRTLAERNVHRLVVADAEGHVQGIVSSMDVVRGLLGLPASHPPAFVAPDARGLEWSQPVVLDAEHARQAPTDGGLLVLIHGGASRPEIPVWAESASNLRERAEDLATAEHLESKPPQLEYLLRREREHLRFRVAVVKDLRERIDALIDADRSVQR